MLENIIPNQTLEMENVLSFREILLEEEVVSISNGLENIIRDTGAEKAGPTVTATHDIDVEKGELEEDIEAYTITGFTQKLIYPDGEFYVNF